MNTTTPPNGMKFVYTIVEGRGKSYWIKVGVAFPNSDGSTNLKLDALPVNGTLQIREPQSWEDRRTEPSNVPASHVAPAEALA